MDLVRTVSCSLTRFFRVPIDCVARHEGGLSFEISSPVFDKGKGVRLVIRRPYKHMVVANAEFDAFASHLIQVWNRADRSTIENALRYLNCFSNRMDIDARIAEQKLEMSEGSIEAIRSLSTPSSFSLRIRSTIGDELDEQCVFEIAQCAYGFLLMLSGVLSEITDQNAEEFDNEGALKQTSLTRYERSARNRALCIAANGTTCAVCGFDFAKRYGAFAAGYIEVHHKQPLSTIGHSHSIDPIKDLVPLCPNCHAAVHMKNPPISPEELREIVANQSGDMNEDS